MAASNPCHNVQEIKEAKEEDEAYQKTYAKYRDTLLNLPIEKGWMTEHLFQYQGLCFSPGAVEASMLVLNLFKARLTDIFVATPPKCGTTWLRALVFTNMNRTQFEFSTHPLHTTNPHGCFTRRHSFARATSFPTLKFFLALASFPYTLLPAETFVTDVHGCRFVYLCRNPKDVLVSKWIFINKSKPKQLPLLSSEEAFELFCQGV